MSTILNPKIFEKKKLLCNSHVFCHLISRQEADAPNDLLYHMTTKAEWEKAKADNHAYYPKTFEADGHYTHATGVPSRLIETANHFYQAQN